MIHLRIDEESEKAKRKFACGLGPDLPTGDVYFFESEGGAHHKIDCPGCKPFCRELGTPISQLSGRPGEPGFEKFSEIASSYGFD